jgi:hypothetical protein
MVKSLLNKSEVLSSNPGTAKNKNKKKKLIQNKIKEKNYTRTSIDAENPPNEINTHLY